MRYYGEDYLQDLKRSITAAYGSVDRTNYSLPIRNTYVNSKRRGMKDRSAQIAQNATGSFASVRQKLNTLQTVLEGFYGEVDETSARILEMTKMIEGMISDSNSALKELSGMLNGVGTYSKKCLTSKMIDSIVLDQKKKQETASKFWVLLIDTEIDNDHLNEKAVKEYVAYLRETGMDDEDLLEEDFNRLKKIYDYYVSHRFGETGDIRDMAYQDVQNCVDVFEILNLYAKYATDVFFSNALAEHDDTIDLNIMRIKYAMYTADPKYRDIMIEYLSDMSLGDYDVDHSRYNDTLNQLYLSLDIDYDRRDENGYIEDHPFGAFFHELGHGINDVTKLFGYSTSGIRDFLADDLKAHMTNVLNENGFDYLSDKERKEILNHIVSYKNANVITDRRNDYMRYLPDDWTDEQQVAYYFLKLHYGYQEYCYLEDPSNIDAYTVEQREPIGDVIKADREHELLDDIIGGLTNDQLGGVYAYHPGISIPNDRKKIKGPDDLVGYLSTGSKYWYYHTIPSPVLGSEFFAEYFNNNVCGYGVNETREVFSSTCDHYDGIIDKIYDDMSDNDKGIPYP
ncbi:MAG: hypothetical protein J6U54_22870 [Clostridiales bacterium]|nr:hypothetical protein [Clostridiales bacterium]